jgi:hypothetical protein
MASDPADAPPGSTDRDEVCRLAADRTALQQTIRRLRGALTDAESVLDRMRTPTTLFVDRSIWFDGE